MNGSVGSTDAQLALRWHAHGCGGDFNVIPEDIDCHKPGSWIHDALFQPETRARYRAMMSLGYTDAFRSLHLNETGQFTFWDYFRRQFEYNRGIRIDHVLISKGRNSSDWLRD